MIGHAATALALILAQTASQPTPPPRPCVTPEEAGAGAAVMLPELVDAVGRNCTRHLPETAFLRTRGTQLVQRWRGESAEHRRLAMAGLMRMIPPDAAAAMRGQAQGTASTPLAEGTGAGQAGAIPSPAAMVPQMLQGLQAAMADKLNPETCKEASRMVESLSPLSAGNIAQLVSATMGLGVALSPPKGDSGPPICRT